MKDADIILSTTRYAVRYVSPDGVKLRTFFLRDRARAFATGKRFGGRAARVEIVRTK